MSRPPRLGADATSRLVLGGYGPLGVVLVVLALLVTLVPSKAPREQTQTISAGPAAEVTDSTSDLGSATNEGPAGTTVIPGAAGLKNAKVALASTCEGGARQTREPYSPPCITFSGNNGGATAPGVTGDTVTVTFREGDLPSVYAVAGQVAEKANIKDTQEDIRRTIRAYFDYFNKHFQLYGRKAEVVFYKGQGDQLSEFFGAGAEAANADALQVAKELKGFADLSVLTTPYAEALVRQKVVAMPPVHMSAAWYKAHRPYAWGVLVDCTRLANSVVDYAVRRLVGKPARYAGDPALRARTRSIGLIVPEQPWYQECAKEGAAKFKAKGGSFAHQINYTLDFSRLSSEAANMVAQMKDAGVTTVACMCDPVLPLFLSTQATQQEYHPEWLVTGTALTDVDLLGQIYDPDQWSHAFGISFLSDINQGVRSESYRTYRAVRDDEPAFIHDVLYYPILMFFLGVHMAGPRLTPETFEQGMFNYPVTQGETGQWSFGPDDYTATDDAREMYFDPNATSPFNSAKGRYVQTLGGKRYVTDWPAGDPVFPIAP
jgi:hypothetical protein